MNKITFLTAAIFISISTGVLSADRVELKSDESVFVSPTSLKSLLALPDNTTKLDLSQLNVQEDEGASYGSDSVSVSTLIDQTKRMDKADLARINMITLRTSLLGNAGFKSLAEGFLPLFPALRFLDLAYDTIEKEKADILYALLAKTPTLQYVNIIGNPLVAKVCYDVGNGMPPSDREHVISKVIVSYPCLIDSLPGDYPQWQQTHRKFYQEQVAH